MTIYGEAASHNSHDTSKDGKPRGNCQPDVFGKLRPPCCQAPYKQNLHSVPCRSALMLPVCVSGRAICKVHNTDVMLHKRSAPEHITCVCLPETTTTLMLGISGRSPVNLGKFFFTLQLCLPCTICIRSIVYLCFKFDYSCIGRGNKILSSITKGLFSSIELLYGISQGNYVRHGSVKDLSLPY